MNKEEILAKSRKEHQAHDPFETAIKEKSWISVRWSVVLVGIVLIALQFLSGHHKEIYAIIGMFWAVDLGTVFMSAVKRKSWKDWAVLLLYAVMMAFDIAMYCRYLFH